MTFVVSLIFFDTKISIVLTLFSYLFLSSSIAYLIKLYLLPKYLLWNIKNVNQYNEWHSLAMTANLLFIFRYIERFLIWSKKNKTEYNIFKKHRFGQKEAIYKFKYEGDPIILSYSKTKLLYNLWTIPILLILLFLTYSTNSKWLIISSIAFLLFSVVQIKDTLNRFFNKKPQLIIDQKGISFSDGISYEWKNIPYIYVQRFSTTGRASLYAGITYFLRYNRNILIIPNIKEQNIDYLTLSPNEIDDVIFFKCRKQHI